MIATRWEGYLTQILHRQFISERPCAGDPAVYGAEAQGARFSATGHKCLSSALPLAWYLKFGSEQKSIFSFSFSSCNGNGIVLLCLK